MLTRMLWALAMLAIGTSALAAEPADKLGGSQMVDPLGGSHLLQVFLSLMLVLGLILLTAWLIRRYTSMPFGRQGVLRLLAAVSVGQRERIVLLQAGETQLLVGVTPSQVRTLHVFDKPVMLADEPVKGGERFAERLSQALKRNEGEQ